MVEIPESNCQHCLYNEAEANECRRHAPTHDGWPTTNPDGWCGEGAWVNIHDFSTEDWFGNTITEDRRS